MLLEEIMRKTEMDNTELIYLYCITDKIPDLQEMDKLSENIFSINCNELYAVAKYVPEAEFSEENLKQNLADINWFEPQVREHIRIISNIMKSSTVIPFKFGTIYNSEKNIKKMIERYSKEFKENLNYLKNKEEWSLKIYCDLKKFNDKIIKDNYKINQLDNEIRESSPGKAYILKKKRKDLISNESERKLNEYGQNCFDDLKKVSYNTKISNLLPKEVTEKQNDMILNTAYLITKDKVKNFINIIEKLQNKYNDYGLEFDYSGPWPSYNFIDIKENE